MATKLATQNYKSFVPTEAAAADFAEHVAAFMPRTAWSGVCRSWFKDGRVDGPVTALHPGGRVHWFHMLEEPRYEDYEWQHVRANRFAYLGNGFSTKEAEGLDDTYYLDDLVRL